MTINRSEEFSYFIHVIVSACQDHRTAESTNRIGDIAMVQSHALICNMIKIGCIVYITNITTYCL